MEVLNVPALVIAVLSYVWFGLTEAAAIGAVTMNKLPLVAVTMREGARSLDRDFDELARVFRFGGWRRWRHVVAPQLMPFFLVAARSGLSLIWKIVLVVELLVNGSQAGTRDRLADWPGDRLRGVEVGVVLRHALADVARIEAFGDAVHGAEQDAPLAEDVGAVFRF